MREKEGILKVENNRQRGEWETSFMTKAIKVMSIGYNAGIKKKFTKQLLSCCAYCMFSYNYSKFMEKKKWRKKCFNESDLQN